MCLQRDQSQRRQHVKKTKHKNMRLRKDARLLLIHHWSDRQQSQSVRSFLILACYRSGLPTDESWAPPLLLPLLEAEARP